MLEILLGQIPEAIYFALFMIFTKRLDKKRGLFITLMVTEYVLLLNVLPFSTWSHILYFVVSYIILKILYKEKSQITDIFTLGIASLIMICVNIPIYFIFYNNYMLAVILDRVLLLTLLFIGKTNLYKIQNIYKLLWNRNDSIHKRIKSTTFRCVNLVTFNIMFYIINTFMLYCLFRR